MTSTWDSIERDGRNTRFVFSMRVKVSIIGLCFLVYLGLIAFYDVPNFAQSVRVLSQDQPLAQNENQTLDQNESPQEKVEEEPPQEQVEEGESLGQEVSSETRIRLFATDFTSKWARV
jgi:hypothetical protein